MPVGASAAADARGREVPATVADAGIPSAFPGRLSQQLSLEVRGRLSEATEISFVRSSRSESCCDRLSCAGPQRPAC